jgi:hypothetical protein
MEKELIEMLAGVLERNTSALENVAKAIAGNEAKNERLADGMHKMVATIAGAQRKVGGELGAVIERGKKLEKDLKAEVDKARRKDIAS